VGEVAGLLGMTTDELVASLGDGASLADVAADQGVDVQAVIDLLVADAQDRLDAAVADGHLTADEAAEKRAEMEARIADMVEGELEFMGRHDHGRREFRDRLDGDGDEVLDSVTDA
jgi:hypothetical protein